MPLLQVPGVSNIESALMVDKIKEDWFQAIVEQAPDAVIFADRDGITRIWNLGAEAVFGYSEARK
ncbi:MAG: PAS domain S-box protein [Burkholderiales bacterium]